MAVSVGSRYIIKDPGILVARLIQDGWRVIGPRLGDGAIVYDEIVSPQDLPRGLVDTQEAGHYRLKKGRDGSWFDYVVGPQSWKKWLFPARHKLWSAHKAADGFEIEHASESWPKTAFFGVRPCEIAAMEVQDRVFDNGNFADPGYSRRREDTLIIVVQCARSAATCFCVSMDTGPLAKQGFDLALTELGEAGGNAFLIDCGSARGAKLLAGIPTSTPEPRHLDAAKAARRTAADGQTRTMPKEIPNLLRENPDHPQWEVVADACLSCANCTLVCPTCFCSDVEDVNDLSGDNTERWRSWDSCFTADFSYVHGGSVRRSTKSRYRQWMTHKLSSWFDQFGSSGCVGCGRCIAWCPVGIDITAEAAAFVTPTEKTED
ncbi:MAG: 4Fe-4S dicluster domain-containing protein [Paracoccaceae bacterium]